MERVYKAGISSLLIVLLGAPVYAQSLSSPGSLPPLSQPIVGFVSPYQIMRALRAAGFEPLSPPLREGTDYVLRANDFRGILMHVVIDARTAAIRDVTRIVPGPGRYGQYYGEPPYGPDDYGAPIAAPTEVSIEPPPPVRPLAPAPHAIPDAALASPPLPRPRPATLALRKTDSVEPAAKPSPPATVATAPNTATPAPVVTPPPANAAPVGKPAALPEAKAQINAPINSQINSEVITAAPPPAVAPSPAKKAPLPVEPLND